jgi:hypothetical protein
MIPREWIFSHRCSWITVYVFCRNAQSKSHSDRHDVCILSCSINCPTIICLPIMCYLSYGETPLVNCGPRSNLLYIDILFYFYLFRLLSCILLSYYHSIRSILCLQQTSEIDNLIVSWEHSSWLCYVQVSRCCWGKTRRQAVVSGALARSVTKLARITF